MASSSMLLRCISRKVIGGGCCRYNGVKSVYTNLLSGSVAGMSTMTDAAVKSSTISPWLMLPPVFEGGGNMVSKFYSLEENKVLSFNTRSEAAELNLDDKTEFVGSSQGWLALFNPRNCNLFLFNPLSRRHVKLPSIHTLPIPEENLEGGYGCVNKVVISSSPDDDDCRAMMTYGPADRLAFCCPGRSADWTPIGAFFDKDDDGKSHARVYEDFVYSKSEKTFFCVVKFGDLEGWDLRDPTSPKMIMSVDPYADKKNYPWAGRSEEELCLKQMSRQLDFLVVAEPNSGDLLFVRRHILEHARFGPDGSFIEYYFDYFEGSDTCPHKTVGFDVHKYDRKGRRLRYMKSSLDGLALVVGLNHSFATKVLKPNTIYFTDALQVCEDLPYGGHDIGIFNYEDRTFSSCYYPFEVHSFKKIAPAPMWFTPNPA